MAVQNVLYNAFCEAGLVLPSDREAGISRTKLSQSSRTDRGVHAACVIRACAMRAWCVRVREANVFKLCARVCARVCVWGGGGGVGDAFRKDGLIIVSGRLPPAPRRRLSRHKKNRLMPVFNSARQPARDLHHVFAIGVA